MKTLKDIDRLVEMAGCRVDYIHMEDLRNAAREWINLFKKDLAKHKQFGEKLMERIRWNQIDWIKDFFNLE